MTVLDASALLAFLLNEPGAKHVTNAILAGTEMTAVNFAEVATVYVRQGASDAEVRDLRAGLVFPLVPADDQLALDAALMTRHTRQAGLSLGDRFCLALARRRGVPALTADRAWNSVAKALDVEVRLIR